MLRKVERLKFIHRGRVYDLMCIFHQLIFDCIPTYVCKNIDDAIALDIENQLLVIVPERYLGNEGDYDYKIWYAVLKKYYLTTTEERAEQITELCDVTLAVWYGFGRMTDLINESKDSKENKIKRIKYLEKMFGNRKNLRTPTKDYVISKLNYITVS